jgi:hypothetical protein
MFPSVRFAVQTAYVPDGLPNPQAFEGFDYHRFGPLPFLSVAGMWLDVGDGDFRKIDDVYWDGNELTVHFVDCDFEYTHASLLERGWILDL